MFLGSIKAPVPPSRPAIPSASRAAAAWGEHGEDPQFAWAEHDAMLRLRRGGLVVVTLTAASSLAGKALRIEDGELVHRLLPMVRCLSPIGGDIAQSQPDQLARRVVTGEMPASFDDFPEAGIHTFDRIGGVDHSPDLRREG